MREAHLHISSNKASYPKSFYGLISDENAQTIKDQLGRHGLTVEIKEDKAPENWCDSVNYNQMIFDTSQPSFTYKTQMLTKMQKASNAMLDGLTFTYDTKDTSNKDKAKYLAELLLTVKKEAQKNGVGENLINEVEKSFEKYLEKTNLAK